MDACFVKYPSSYHRVDSDSFNEQGGTIVLNYKVEGGVTVVTRILSVLDDPESGLSDVADVIMEDSVMTAKVLSIANQEWFGLSKQISNPHVAVSLVGPDIVRSVAMLHMVEGSDCPASLRSLSRVTGDKAAMLAPRYQVKPAVAQCAGLVLYLGDVMIYQQDRSNYDRLDRLPIVERTKEEIKLYGAPRDVLTSELLDHWNFPVEIVRGIRERFNPDTESNLAQLLRSAEIAIGERNSDGKAIQAAESSLDKDRAIEVGISAS